MGLPVLVEAVPNLALGPDHPALDHVLKALDSRAAPGWGLLDVHTDGDHDRTVLTLAGAPVPLLGALVAMVQAALEAGSLPGHDGVHPRVGLVDVLPLVPLPGARVQDAARTARCAAGTLAARGVPIHLYGALAADPEHRVLAPIRREHRRLGLPGSGAEHGVDLGPASPRAAFGCTCVGVRGVLVAYNVLLDTTDREVGEALARSLRASRPDGLPGVQALAFPLESRGGAVQVSCNLTDVAATGPPDVYAALDRRARAHGIQLAGGELVGLAPGACLPEDPARMGLDQRPESLEERLVAAGLAGEGVSAPPGARL